MHEAMTGKIIAGNIKTVKTLCKPKLKTSNLMQGINTSAVSGLILHRTIERQNLYRKTRKIMNKKRCLHNRSNFARLYIPRNQGWQGLISTEESVMNEKSLQNHLMNSKEPFLKITWAEKNFWMRRSSKKTMQYWQDFIRDQYWWFWFPTLVMS